MKTKMRIVGMNRFAGNSMTHHNCGSVYFVTADNEVGSMFYSGSMHGTSDDVRCLSTLSVCWRDRKGKVKSLDVNNRGEKTVQSVFDTEAGPVTITVKAGRIFLKMPKEFSLTFSEAWKKRK